MKAISFINGMKIVYSAGDLGRMDYSEFCEDYVLIFGESAEIKPVYTALSKNINFYSEFSDRAKFSEHRMYGIIVEKGQSGLDYRYTVIGENTLVRFLYDLI